MLCVQSRSLIVRKTECSLLFEQGHACRSKKKCCLLFEQQHAFFSVGHHRALSCSNSGWLSCCLKSKGLCAVRTVQKFDRLNNRMLSVVRTVACFPAARTTEGSVLFKQQRACQVQPPTLCWKGPARCFARCKRPRYHPTSVLQRLCWWTPCDHAAIPRCCGDATISLQFCRLHSLRCQTSVLQRPCSWRDVLPMLRWLLHSCIKICASRSRLLGYLIINIAQGFISGHVPSASARPNNKSSLLCAPLCDTVIVAPRITVCLVSISCTFFKAKWPT